MALACPPREARVGTTPGIREEAIKRSDFTRTGDFDWPGRVEFAELGELLTTTEIEVLTGSVTVGVFRDEEAFYLASSRPHVVAGGLTMEAAVNEYTRELFGKWKAARTLKGPLAAATQNDVDKLLEVFGSL